MNDALSLLYIVYEKFTSWIFGSYFFTGVSIGMFLIGCFVFMILLRFLVAIPRLHVSKSYKGREEND